MSKLTEAIRSEALMASRAGQYENLTAIAFKVNVMEEKLARIEALCDDLETTGSSFGAIKRLRAILRGDA